MTKQDKNAVIRELKKLIPAGVGLVAVSAQQAVSSCIQAVRTMPEEEDWIPVTERLPDEAEVREWLRKYEEYPEYLVTIDGAMTSTTLRYWGGDTWVDWQDYTYKVTHWKHLPPVPGKETVS